MVVYFHYCSQQELAVIWWGLSIVSLQDFAFFFLIVIQCIIFTWFYDVEGVIPILNENDRVKVGKTWLFVLKYVLPLFLLFMWITGVYHLLLNSNNFELIVYGIISVVVLILSYIFTNINKEHH